MMGYSPGGNAIMSPRNPYLMHPGQMPLSSPRGPAPALISPNIRGPAPEAAGPGSGQATPSGSMPPGQSPNAGAQQTADAIRQQQVLAAMQAQQQAYFSQRFPGAHPHAGLAAYPYGAYGAHPGLAAAYGAYGAHPSNPYGARAGLPGFGYGLPPGAAADPRYAAKVYEMQREHVMRWHYFQQMQMRNQMLAQQHSLAMRQATANSGLPRVSMPDSLKQGPGPAAGQQSGASTAGGSAAPQPSPLASQPLSSGLPPAGASVEAAVAAVVPPSNNNPMPTHITSSNNNSPAQSNNPSTPNIAQSLYSNQSPIQDNLQSKNESSNEKVSRGSTPGPGYPAPSPLSRPAASPNGTAGLEQRKR